MANTDVSTSTTLRSAIQTAGSSDTITLKGTVPTSPLDPSGYSVLTLAKRSSFAPKATRFSGYTVQGTSSTLASSALVINTRIYQQNVDGAYAPGSVKDLTLSYTAGGEADGGALLSVTSAASRSISLENVLITGVHKGWNGNGNLYMSLRSFNAAAPLNTLLALTGVTVNLTGQNNLFNGTTGGSAFLHSWNNNGPVTLSNCTFDEAGFASSLNLLTFGTTAAGSYTINSSTFKRTFNQTVRAEGNRLGSVVASLTGNTFQDGSYLDLYGNVGSVTLTSNTFATIYGGSGIRFNDPNAPLTGTPSISGNSFTGYGLAISYVKTDASNNPEVNSVYTVNGTNSVTAGTLSAKSFTRFTAGGAAGNTISLTGGDNWVNGGGGADTITTNGGNDYIIGGAGADTITTGGGSDTVLYYATNEGADIITDFTPGTDKLAFRQGGGGTNAFASTIIFETGISPTTASATWTYNGGSLLYWANGNSGASTTIATFTGSPGITASDLVTF
jgi:hypothetical protein